LQTGNKELAEVQEVVELGIKPITSAHYLFLVSLHELVKNEENGLIFKDSNELSQQLKARHSRSRLSLQYLESFVINAHG